MNMMTRTQEVILDHETTHQREQSSKKEFEFFMPGVSTRVLDFISPELFDMREKQTPVWLTTLLFVIEFISTDLI